MSNDKGSTVKRMTSSDQQGGGIILLTACVSPGRASKVARHKVADRLNDYRRAVDHWSTVAQANRATLMVVENSDWDMASELAAWGHSNCQLLTFAGTEISERGGKGAGEAEMFDRAFSERSNELSSAAWVAKVTGRIVVSNPHFPSALASTGSASWASCRFRYDLERVDTRFFVASPEFWKAHLMHLGPEVDEPSGRYLEHVVRDRVIRAIASGDTYFPFNYVPRFRGFSGTMGGRYGGPVDRLKELLAGMYFWDRENVFI